jgi:hypothetical protein
VAAELKLLSLILKFADANRSRRGLFAAIQRAIVLLRSISLLPRWARYIDVPIARCSYVVARAVYVIRLAWGLLGSWRNYSANGVETAKPVPRDAVTDVCPVCRSAPRDPVRLECGHIFCQDCIGRWLIERPCCPVCRRPTRRHIRIELADGRTELALLIFPL